MELEERLHSLAKTYSAVLCIMWYDPVGVFVRSVVAKLSFLSYPQLELQIVFDSGVAS
jgi:hypothetical protein